MARNKRTPTLIRLKEELSGASWLTNRYGPGLKVGPSVVVGERRARTMADPWFVFVGVLLGSLGYLVLG